jgi:MerR family transcriptional regulator, light-induced transcriptional regulator
MRKRLNEYSDEPIYNMRAVEQQTGTSAATLRAWERRYALVEPKRTASGYRLYSDRDVALLRWVRSQMEEGLTISRVVARMQNLSDTNEAIWVEAGDARSPVKQDSPLPPNSLVQPLFQALVDLDDNRADEIMEQAFAMYTMSTVYVDLIAPTLVEIGEAWHRGEVFISSEHFATTYLRGRLLSLLQAYPHQSVMPMIFVGCAPRELHDVGALIFGVLLRQQGFNAIYLGQDVPLEDIVRAALHKHPLMICLSASSPGTALALRDIQPHLAQVEPPAPIFGYGGRAFDQDPDLRRIVGVNYLGSDPRDALNVVNNLVRIQRHA